jgi:hypothetical protein
MYCLGLKLHTLHGSVVHAGVTVLLRLCNPALCGRGEPAKPDCCIPCVVSYPIFMPKPSTHCMYAQGQLFHTYGQKVHFAKVSTLYPRVGISSLAKRLEKSPFCHSYTSFGVWPRDHYMQSLAKVVRGTIPMLRFPGVVLSTTHPLAPCKPR